MVGNSRHSFIITCPQFLLSCFILRRNAQNLEECREYLHVSSSHESKRKCMCCLRRGHVYDNKDIIEGGLTETSIFSAFLKPKTVTVIPNNSIASRFSW